MKIRILLEKPSPGDLQEATRRIKSLLVYRGEDKSITDLAIYSGVDDFKQEYLTISYPSLLGDPEICVALVRVLRKVTFSSWSIRTFVETTLGNYEIH